MILIQGFFFVERQHFGIGYDTSGERAVFQEVTLRSMFAGVIGPDQGNSDILVGRMTDNYGDSTLRSILFKGNKFNFVKLYDNRTDHIDYKFTKNVDDTWAGIFDGKATGSGQARCILTIVPENFLLPIQKRPVRKGGPLGNPLERYRR